MGRLEWGMMSKQEDIEEYMKRTYSDKLAYGEPHQLYRTPEAEFSRPQPSPGLILTGGWLGLRYVYSQEVRSNVETFAESGNPNCSIPDLPTRRLLHTTSVFKNGTLVVCGGMYTENTCISWNRASPDNVWEFAATLSIPRTRAVTFMDPVNNNILLMGGDDADAMKTGVAIRVGYSYPVQRQFDLEHSANSACLIPLKSNLHEHSFVITGGIASDGYVQHYVDRYQSTGYFDMELPSLNTGRWNHACSSYLDKYNVDVLLVTGGNSQWNNWQLDEYLATTELLEEGGSEWRTVPNLSRGRNGARAANIGGKIFLLGGQDENKDYPEEIFKFNEEQQRWDVENLSQSELPDTEVGRLEEGRGWVGLVEADLSAFCR